MLVVDILQKIRILRDGLWSWFSETGRSPDVWPRWLQKAFNVPLVIQMTDDEKFLWKASDASSCC